MSAGDLVNNLGKLEQKLKQVNFRNFRRSELLSGTVDIYISIYGYVFSDFSRELSKLIASHELELYGKTSKRFVDNLYLIVRDILHYKPPINKEMLLSNCGFVEMKMIMCTEILELVLAKCKELISSENKRKICRKPGYLPLSVPGNNANKNNNNIKHVSGNKHATNTTVSKREPLQHKISIQANEKKLKAVTETENTDKTTKVKSSHLFCHLSSNYSRLSGDQVSSEIPRHSKSNDCAIAKNPVSKCSVAPSSYSKSKSVVLEKQGLPRQKVRIKVLKGPLQINDGFSGVPMIIPPEKLSSSNHVSFYQDSVPNIKSSGILSPTKPTEQGTINATVPVSVVNITTTTIPKSRENAVTITTSGLKDGGFTDLTSSTSTIINHTRNKPRKVHRPVAADTMPKYTNTSISILTTPAEDTAPAESKLMENTAVLKPPDANNQPQKMNLLTYCGSYAVGSTKVASVQNLKASNNDRSQTENVLSQIKDLSQNLTSSAEALQQMRERSHQWDMQKAFLNCSGQNKENTPTLNNKTVPGMSGGKIKQDSVDLDKTKESEDPTHQLDYWIAKMNLMECAVKSLESKFKSL